LHKGLRCFCYSYKGSSFLGFPKSVPPWNDAKKPATTRLASANFAADLDEVLKVLRAENRAYWWGKPTRSYEWTKHQVIEMFAPGSQKWREQCVAQGLEICKQAFLD